MMKGSYWVSALLVTLLFGVPVVRSEQVVFSEIMYHPPGTQPEYIELCNNTATPLDVAEWRMTQGVEYVFPVFSADQPERTFLKPFERILLAGVDEATLRAAYNIPPTVRVYGPWTGNLKNGSERITLRDKNDSLVCTMSYDDWRFPATDGAGHSLVVKNPDRNIDNWRNWQVSRQRGGTPGVEEVEAAETPAANPEVNLVAGIPFVNYGDVWRYNDQNVDLGTLWRAPAYDDSAWPQGPGLFGFENAALPAPGLRTGFNNSQQLTFYLRTEFTYNGSLKGVTVTVDQVLDDGAVYYLNGQEIGRSGMAGGAVDFTTTANRTVGDATEELAVITTDGSALVNGTNVLAAEVHQTSRSSSDVVFGARLNISVPMQPSLQINEVLPAAAGTGFVEFYNPGTGPINLRDHYLTDDPANLRKFRITANVTVPAHGLASVGFAESGLAVSSPVKVYLAAPDGGTIVNAISTTMPLDGRSLGRKPAGSSSWFLFTEPTRDRPNASQSDLAATVHLNEVHFSASKMVDWVEFYNSGTEAESLDGLFLASKADLSDKVLLAGSLPPGGCASQGFAFPVSGDQVVTLFLVNEMDTVLLARIFERPTHGDSLQAFPQGSSEWYASTTSTRGAANNPARNTDIVINEILFDPPSNEPACEFIELYNCGTAAVDVSGWQFVNGVDFIMPPGTTIPRDGYLVVAADAEWMRATYGNLPVVGDWEGRLGNQGELVRLVDQWGNLADEVDYLSGGDWPHLTNGDGSSMELRHPSMNNSLSSAWADSDESAQMPFAHYGYTDTFQQLNTMGQPSDYKELHFYLVGDSHLILKNIQVRQNGTGPNLIFNGDKMSTNGQSANGWLAQGTHWASHLENGELHLISDGHGDNRPNRVEIDVTGMQQGQKYEISFDARWVSGASRLIIETWDHSIATSISLPVPAGLGTPGARNSCFIPQPAPQVDGLMHYPVVPTSGQAVRVTARITSQTPAPTVLLYHRRDNNAGNGVWASKPMVDDGSSGDEQAGDGVYTAQLTEYGQNGQVVQFYVVASGPGGQSTQQPREGEDRPAMYVVDTPTGAGDLRRMRFVMSALDLRDMAEQDGATPPYGYAFPRLSNHYFNATIIVNEKDVFYGAEMRPSGSPWTRGGGVDRAKFKYPRDNLFRNKGNLVYRNYDVGWWSHDRIVRYWLYLLGNPTNENEFILVEVNNGGASVREEMEVVGNDMLDRAYENGSQGELYKIDDEWWFTDNWNRNNRDADWSYKSSDNPGRYRSEWMKRTRENEDDYSSLVSFFKKVYQGPYTQAEIERLVDPVACLKACAVAGYIHAWDFFSLDRGKNSFFYRRSTDGRFMFFPWDMKRSFDNAGASFYNQGRAGFGPWLTKSYNFRLFKHYLNRLLENYTRNSVRIYYWLQLEEEASTQYTFNFSYQSWFASRENPAFNLLGQNRSLPFNIATGGRAPLATAADTVNLVGVAPLRVFKVEVAGHPEAQFSWIDESTWNLTGVLLHAGVNELTVSGVDEFGTVLEQGIATVVKTGDAPPVMALQADPPSWQVSALEPLNLDASGSYDPEGTPLSYSWSVTPSDVLLDASAEITATALFSHPGLYTFTVAGQDANVGSTSIQREAAVYGPDGFSAFDAPRLEPFWALENVRLRPNYTTGPSYSLTEIPGRLVLQVWSERAFPLAAAAPKYPLIWREVPATTDWAFQARLELRAQVFGDYMTGVLAEINEAGSPVRYAFGIEDGSLVNVRRITATGTATALRTNAWSKSQAELRLRRTGDTLSFEQRVNEVWVSRHTATLPAGSVAVKAGLFLATDTAQSSKVAFDDATVVDPGSGW